MAAGFPLIVILAWAASVSAVHAGLRSFVAYSNPVSLRPGEVNNHAPAPVTLPNDIQEQFANKTMAIKGYDVDIVSIDPSTGVETSLPLTEFYNHHYIMSMGTTEAVAKFVSHANQAWGPSCIGGEHMQHLMDEVGLPGSFGAGIFGGGSGAEFRHTNYTLPSPFATMVWNPQSFALLLHFINTKGSTVDDRRFECPCFPTSNKIDIQNGTINGRAPHPRFKCSEELKRQGNPACSLANYTGGLRCCEHGVWVVPTPDRALPFDTMYAKITFHYYAGVEPRDTHTTSCCDASGGNIEYDVLPCAPGTSADQCIHTATHVAPLDFFEMHGDDPSEEVQLVHTVGHQHTGGLGMELRLESTDELLCHSLPRYGTGRAAGDESGFLVGISGCSWGAPPLRAPPRLKRGDLIRTIARYNATVHRHGVMSLWLMKAVSAKTVVGPIAMGSHLNEPSLLV
jgi:hypothetical protein